MPEPSVQSVARAFHILEALARAKRPAALQEVSEALGLSKSTVHRLLSCLVELGYAEHLPGGRYRPAVSYTHLDVYKRQVYSFPPRR